MGMKEEFNENRLVEQDTGELTPVDLNMDDLFVIEKMDTSDFSISKLPVAKVSQLGNIASQLGDMGDEGLYRVTFPKGVKGKLAKFRDGSGNTAAIMNENGIVGQARLNREMINPEALCMAAALASIENKLEQITELQEQMLNMMVFEKEAKIEADMKLLYDAVNDYKYNADNEVFKNTEYNQIKDIKRNAEQNMISCRKQIESNLEKQSFIHGDVLVNKMANSIYYDFAYYRMSLYEMAFASFLGVVMADAYDENYLNSLMERLQDKSLEYKELYTKCYNVLETYAKSSVETVLKGGFAKVSKFMGTQSKKVPGIKNTNINEKLISVGDKVDSHKEDNVEGVLNKFINYKENGVSTFSDNIQKLNNIYNEGTVVYLKGDSIYLG